MHLPRTVTCVISATLSRAVWAEHEYIPSSSMVTLDIVRLAPSIIILPGKKWGCDEDENNRKKRNVILSFPWMKYSPWKIFQGRIFLKTLSHNAFYWRIQQLKTGDKTLFKHTKMSTSHERDQVCLFLIYEIQLSVILGSVMKLSCLVCLKTVQ